MTYSPGSREQVAGVFGFTGGLAALIGNRLCINSLH